MIIAVQKYGGSSLADVSRLRNVAARVADCHRAGPATVVVVSARGDTTDDLLAAAGGVGGVQPGRELDQLLVTGENASAALLALALRERGVPAVSLTAGQAGITAAGRHGAGIIAAIDGRRILHHLAAGAVVVVTGFQGVAANGDVLTLGRGGSDTSAVAIAVALGARCCEIYTDVEGIYSADPRVVPGARLLTAVDVGVMAEMAFAGAHVLHPRAVELAAVRHMDLVVRSSLTRTPGTAILGGDDTNMIETDGFVTAVTHDTDVASVAIAPRRTDPAFARRVLAALARASVPVDMVTWSEVVGRGMPVRFVVRRSDLPQVVRALGEFTEVGGARLQVVEDVGKLSLVGVGMFSRPEHAAAMLNALAEIDVTASLMSSTQLRISVIVPLDRLIDGACALHRQFQLHRHDLSAGSLASA
jgi:aspartate kinase